MTSWDIERKDRKITALLPLSEYNDKFQASLWAFSDTHVVEFFRTSNYNYKIYALKRIFP
jgi:hypothetical protein